MWSIKSTMSEGAPDLFLLFLGFLNPIGQSNKARRRARPVRSDWVFPSLIESAQQLTFHILSYEM